MANTTFTREEQTEIVRMAATLEIAIEDEKNELKRLNSQKFKNPPERPVKRRVKTQAQQVQPDYSNLPKFNVTFSEYLTEQSKADNKIWNRIYQNNPIPRGIMLAPILFVAWIVLLVVTASGFGGLFFGYILLMGTILGAIGAIPGAFAYRFHYKHKYDELKRQAEFQIHSSPDYIAARLAAEHAAQEATQKSIEIHQQELAQIQADYEKAVEDYEKRILPQYEADKQKWTRTQNLKIKMIQTDLAENEKKLNDLYNQTKLISTHFREIYQLVWIYEEMSSSQHDLDAAIQLLNDDTTHNLLRGIISDVNSMHNDMLQGMQSIYMQLDAINNRAEITNEILDEMSDNLRKTRRDMNIGNIVGTYQRRKFRKEFNEFRKQFI